MTQHWIRVRMTTFRRQGAPSSFRRFVPARIRALPAFGQQPRFPRIGVPHAGATIGFDILCDAFSISAWHGVKTE